MSNSKGRRNRKTISRRLWSPGYLLVPALALMVSCDDSGSESATALTGDLRACELLPAEEVARLIGEPVPTSTPFTESTNGAYALSQCKYSSADQRSGLTMLIRRSGVPITPESREADAERQRSEDDGTGAYKALADAIVAGKNVDGLGDLAYAFELSGHHLTAYFKDHYEIRLTLHNGGDAGEALQIAEEAAKFVIDQF